MAGVERALCATASAPISIASPSGVPVPCASMLGISVGARLVRPITSVSIMRCADPLGAVRLAERPSWRTMLPLSNALPVAGTWAALITSAPMPSARAYPLARASRVLQRPSDDSIPAEAAPREL
eukprot:6422754-Prymnesium_polylepis.1